MITAIGDADELAYSETGPVGGTLLVFFTIPGTKLTNSFAPYIVTSSGLYVAHTIKAGMFRSATAIWRLTREDIASHRREMIRELDGSVKRIVHVGEKSGGTVSMFSYELAGSDTHARDAMRGICQGLAIPPEDGYDY